MATDIAATAPRAAPSSESPVARLGYVGGPVVRLVVKATAALLFWPAAGSGEYWPFLVALFVLAGGITRAGSLPRRPGCYAGAGR